MPVDSPLDGVDGGSLSEERLDVDIPDVESDALKVDLDISFQDFGRDATLESLVDAAMVDEGGLDLAVDQGPSSGPYTTAQVDAIFLRDCGSCHNSTASPPLNTGVSAWINRRSGQSPLPLIQPGNHQRSYLYHKMADTHRMPPSNGRGTGMPMGRQLYSEGRLERMAGWIDNL